MLGYALVFWSGLALGRQYSAEVTIQKDHRLITAGPYKWIRHPRYLGVVLLSFGLSLAFRSWIGLAAGLLVLGILLFRIHDEEVLLHREFGVEWERYTQKSWRMVPGIFFNAYRCEDLMTNETLFRIGFWALLGGILGMRAYFSIRVRRSGGRVIPDRAAVGREGLPMFLARVIGFFILLAVLVLYGFNSPWMHPFAIPFPDGLRAACFLLALASLVFWIWAQTVLDKEWSPQLQLQTGHRLVTAGPYARMRHPIYTAIDGWAAWFALETANWIFVAFAVLFPMVFLLRVPREEKMMLDRFGGEYREYMKRTGRVFPKF